MDNKPELKALESELADITERAKLLRREHATVVSTRGGRKSLFADIGAVAVLVIALFHYNANGKTVDALCIICGIAAVALMVFSFLLKNKDGKRLREIEGENAALAKREKELKASIASLKDELGEGDGML